jgi:outer membrane protein assembly factor BamD
MKYSLAFFVAIWLTGCSIFGTPTELDETKAWPAERIYQEADTKMRDRDFDKAIKYFKNLRVSLSTWQICSASTIGNGLRIL